MNLYLRLLRILISTLRAGSPQHALATARLKLRVWPHDCDLNFHMNNGRYLTVMDLGRLHLLGRMGLLAPLFRRKWAPVLAAAEISYIRPLAPFVAFELASRVAYWDEKYFYLEQTFSVGERLCAQATVKGLFVHNRAPVATADVLALLVHAPVRPDMPTRFAHWDALLAAKKRGE